MDFLKNTVTGVVGQATGIQLSHWHDGICECMSDTGICIQTCCCIYCTLSNIQNKRDYNMGTCDCSAFIAILIGNYITSGEMFYWLGFALRRELVQKYNIADETVCKSCLLGTCCFPCTFCQVQREMAKRDDHAGGCCANPPPPTVSTMAVGGVFGSALGGALGQLVGGVTNTIQTGHQPHPWTSGLCGCSFMECCEGTFCYPCMFGYMANRLDAGRTPMNLISAPNAMDPINCCSALWFPQSYAYANRREVIQRYNVIGESHTMTCIHTLCCYPCAACQQRREMGYGNEWPGAICALPTAPANAPFRGSM
jgi:Cys-rich protein (TIGR01571 family)